MLRVGLIEQSECTALFTLHNENPGRRGCSSVSLREALGVSLSVTLRVTLLWSKLNRSFYDLMNLCWLGGRFVLGTACGDHGITGSTTGVALILAVAQFLAVPAFEVWVTGQSRTGGLNCVVLLLLFARGVGRGGRARHIAFGFEIFQTKIECPNFLVEANGRGIRISPGWGGRG
jgi:hypothetical protein